MHLSFRHGIMLMVMTTTAGNINGIAEMSRETARTAETMDMNGNTHTHKPLHHIIVHIN